MEQMDRYKENYELTIEQLRMKNAQLEEKVGELTEKAREAEKNYKN